MTYLLIAIVCSTGNHLWFKAFARYRVDLLSAIVANYLACVLIGYGSSAASTFRSSIFSQDWYLLSVVQGAMLVICFLLIGRTTQKHGAAPASLATRLAVVIPTVAAFGLYGDVVSVPKIAGVLAAIPALYLSCADPSELRSIPKPGLLPVALFVAFGLHSALLKLVQEHFLGTASYHAYVMSAFLSALVISSAILGRRLLKKLQRCKGRDFLLGLLLGCTNYGAVYFLIRVLGLPGWESSQIFPTISIAVVSLSALGAWAGFGERVSRRMLMALAIGAAAIVLVNL